MVVGEEMVRGRTAEQDQAGMNSKVVWVQVQHKAKGTDGMGRSQQQEGIGEWHSHRSRTDITG